MMLIEVGMDLVQPTIMQKIIDNGIAENNQPYIYKMFGIMIASALIGLIGGIGCSVFASKAAINFSTDLRKDLYETITYFSSANKDKFTLGKLITNLTSDVEMLQRALTMMLKIFVRGPMLFIGAVVIVYVTIPELFHILYWVVPILAFAMYYFTKLSAKLFYHVQNAIDKVNTRMQESLAGIRVIKAYNRKKQQEGQFDEANTTLMKRSITADQIIGILQPFTMFVVNMGIIAALWFGAIEVDNNVIDAGVILAFINYLMIIMNGLTSSANVLVQIARAIPSATRIVTVLEEEPAVKNIAAPITTPIQGAITFNDVSFAYVKANEPVLKNVSFHIHAGQTLGIVGMTGSGKSTLIKLIPRLFDADSGELLIDGRPIQTYDLATLRESIGYTPQKATLFSQTVAENVLYGKAGATEQELQQALEHAKAAEFVEKLADGTAQQISQHGTNLSGGQKQRLALARAFIRKPAILILDDTTSAVDAISEKAIQQAIAQDFAESTKIIISSKISSIRNADKIIVLEDGRIHGDGTHEELLTTNEIYQNIVATQAEKGGMLHE
jgi:ATP-binding cassette, subfamily B, multidrug efflux pump